MLDGYEKGYIDLHSTLVPLIPIGTNPSPSWSCLFTFYFSSFNPALSLGILPRYFDLHSTLVPLILRSPKFKIEVLKSFTFYFSSFNPKKYQRQV